MEEKGANVRRKSEKRKPPRARREKIQKILNYRKWPRRPCRNSMNCVTHTHTLSSPRSRKGCLRKRGTGSHRCVHNNTQRHNNTDAESHSPTLIHRISFTESHSPILIHRTEIRMSHAGCRGYIGRQEHPETPSNTRTYGTKKSSYVHAYRGKDGKWRKRVQT